MFDVAGEVQRLDEATASLASRDLSGLSDQERLAAVRTMWATAAMNESILGQLLAGLEADGVCDRDFGMGTAAWAAHETHGDRRVAATRVNVAMKLRGPLAETGAALARGDIGFEHARALADAANPRIVDLIAAEQGEWIARAGREPFRSWVYALRARVEVLDQDGPFDPDRDRARNRLSITPNGPDSILIRGELVGELAIGFTQAVEAQADGRFRQAVKDHAEADIAVPPRATLRAEALGELVRRGHAADPSTVRAPVPDVTLVIHDTEPDQISSLDGQFKMAFERLAHLACLPAITAAAVSVDGVVLALGRTQRYAPNYQRRVLILRDGGCTFPGCGAPASWCDAHHVHHWEDGGLTDIANLANR